ncbi:SusC/RagA family TonB-linked outer membrane protein [Flammeovirga agarivorans]|uniref:TonB-dependent receptor n=1 Tax=Flammeovirga agarivorans TaxID=2726742 RepID=A0A7X8SJY4_9BACT|nr:TonB-dependent receptor [Flammeovirga agarivorans]NLR91555.1 TonB-dependent receptor [Flammeovirga agarivorans]
MKPPIIPKYCLSVLLLFAVFTSAFAQEVIVSGTVVSAGQSLPGVNVVVKGTTNGTVTNFDGHFSITVQKEDILVFSYIGYLTQEKEVGSSVTFDIELEEDRELLEEVVVVGYGTQKRKEVTGAVNNVGSEALEKVPTPDLGSALQGQVAGVNVQAASGAPGEAANIQIRGVGSLAGSREPLYVVDGIPYQGNPNIAPSQIKSIDILKDGASAAVYGVRASNGVILITTKTGDPGKVKVDFTAWGGVQNITSGTELMDTHQQFYYDELRAQATGIESSVLAVNPRALENNTDFISTIQNDNASIQNYELNVSSGKGDLLVNANVNYFNQEGILINSGFERLATRLTGSINKDKFKLFTSIGFQNENRQREPWGLYEQALRQRPWNTPIEDIPTNGDVIQVPDQNEITYSYLSGILSNTDLENIKRLNIAFNASYEFVKGLTYQVRAGSNIFNSTRSQFQPKYIVLDYNGNYNPTASRPQARLNDDYVWNQRYTLENILTYSKSFGKHNLNFTGTYSFEQYTNRTTGLNMTFAENGNNDVQVPGAAVSVSNPTGGLNETALVGMMGRFQYSYDSKYLFSVSLRRDGTSQFNPENRFDVFPGVSLGWNIDRENFFNVDWISGLKVRASYAELGNNRVGNNPYIASTVIEQGVNYIYGSGKVLTPGLTQRRFSNPDISWETSVAKNIGIDMNMFNDRLQFTADVYQNDKKDMILGQQLPLSAGVNLTRPDSEIQTYRTMTLNAGDMTNEGIELSLSYKNQTEYGLNYSLGMTFTKNTNIITSLNGVERGYPGGRPSLTHGWMDYTTFMAEGYEAASFFLVQTDGVIKTEEELVAYQEAINPNARLGDIRYVDQNGDGNIDDNDRVYAGSGMPDFESGIVATLGYKGFDFFIQGYYSHGAEIINGAKLYAYAEARHADLVGMWSPQNPDSDIPLSLNRQDENVRAFSDRWIEDGSYFRIRTMTLGYDLSRVINNAAGISKARIYVSAVNPFTFTKYTGYDPEVGGDGLLMRGVDRGNYPVSRQFLIGAQLSF